MGPSSNPSTELKDQEVMSTNGRRVRFCKRPQVSRCIWPSLRREGAGGEDERSLRVAGRLRAPFVLRFTFNATSVAPFSGHGLNADLTDLRDALTRRSEGREKESARAQPQEQGVATVRKLSRPHRGSAREAQGAACTACTAWWLVRARRDREVARTPHICEISWFV